MRQGLQVYALSILGPDNLCDIYDVRPKACAAFPHTDRKKIYQINHLTIKNTLFLSSSLPFCRKTQGQDLERTCYETL